MASERDLIVSAADLWGLGVIRARCLVQVLAQRIAELNLRFFKTATRAAEEPSTLVRSLGIRRFNTPALGRISCHRGAVCSLLSGASLVSRENGFSGRFRASDDS